MKKTILFFAMLLSVIVASAKDIKTVVFTTNPIMHCENCENKIKGNLRFEKGVKSIETNVQEQRVTVSYDAAKTDAAKLQKAFNKFGYNATVVGCDGKSAKPECGKMTGCGEKKMTGCSEKNMTGCSGEMNTNCCGGKKECGASAKPSCCNAGAEKKEGCGSCK